MKALKPDLMHSREARALLRVSRAKFDLLRREPDFPAPVRLGHRSLRWWRWELELFLATRQG